MKELKLVFLLLLLSIQSCKTQPSKINGVSFVASRDEIDDTHIKPVVNINANYAAIMPFGFIRDLSNPNVIYNSDRQWFGETKQGTKQYIEVLKTHNVKIMLKPQIWVKRGVFTGLIEMGNDTDWKLLEDSYSNFILDYAEVAEAMKVEIFCIGTELEKFVSSRPEFWELLITKIKNIYSGELTYAANWDEFKRTPFWGRLDYIGVDAYFPISKNKTPNYDACLEGWQEHKQVIKDVSDVYNKPILFTEYGYRSVDYAGRAPWESDRSMNQVNLEAQTNATRALFDTFWNEDWFVGGFIWKWHHNHDMAGGGENSRFTPQNKPVEALVKAQYYKK